MTPIKTDTVGTELYQYIKLDMGATTASAPFTGTFLQVNALGTLSTGTVDSVSQLPPNAFGTVINTTGSTFGTMKPGVAGSVIYVTDIMISVGSATNVAIFNGSIGALLIGTLQFAVNGGAVSNFRTPLFTTSGSALTYQQSTSGAPLSISVQGFVR